MKPLAPLLPIETSSWSAQAFAIVSRHWAVRQLNREFEEECDRAMALARGLTDDEPTKVER